jgi:hypothetical protein
MWLSGSRPDALISTSRAAVVLLTLPFLRPPVFGVPGFRPLVAIGSPGFYLFLLWKFGATRLCTCARLGGGRIRPRIHAKVGNSPAEAPGKLWEETGSHRALSS